MLTLENRKTRKIAVLILVTAVTAFFHFIIPTERHTSHVIHIILRKLYFLPPVLAAVWFGLRGSVYVTLAVSVLFSLHVFLDWPGNYMEQANQVGELASFWVVGLIAGRLFEREQSLLRDLARANEETLVGLVSALDLRERNTRLHSQRVKEYTLLLADRFGLSEAAKKEIGFGALLHDVGKIAVPDHILLTPEGLTKEEWDVMHTHPLSGYGIVRRIGFLREAAEIVRAHHERFDGSGYPMGLKGEDIPFGARIFAVADVYDALTSQRPYHSPLAHDEAVSQIRGKSGTDFDPNVVQMFLTVDPEEFAVIRGRYPDGFAEKAGK
ncbi:MAG TPA: HD domain-containing phosphohydrolase [Nitrospirota bacterium]|nr:HD domain-containing phosphohydrolase [Nitrospirota bacterium]